MNKVMAVLGVAAVATLAGCKDPNYKTMATSPDEVKTLPPAQTQEVKNSCACPAGTTHTSPCACGADDCACVVVQEKPKPAPAPEAKPAPEKAPEADYTLYIVQRGDYLAKISKKFNVKIDAIKSLNNLKNDTIRLGQKLKLPGKIDVGEQKEPTQASSPKAKKAPEADYTGATKDYVIKRGDTLGGIAYSHGCTIRQLKKMNNLSSDAIREGKTLKVPAEAKKAAPTKETAKPAATKVEEKKPVAAPAPAPTPAPQPAAAATPEPTDAEEAPDAVDAAPATVDYTVREGDDLIGLSVRFGVDASVIQDLNNMPPEAQVTAGQVIKLPASAL